MMLSSDFICGSESMIDDSPERSHGLRLLVEEVLEETRFVQRRRI